MSNSKLDVVFEDTRESAITGNFDFGGSAIETSTPQGHPQLGDDKKPLLMRNLGSSTSTNKIGKGGATSVADSVMTRKELEIVRAEIAKT